MNKADDDCAPLLRLQNRLEPPWSGSLPGHPLSDARCNTTPQRGEDKRSVDLDANRSDLPRSEIAVSIHASRVFIHIERSEAFLKMGEGLVFPRFSRQVS